jgi:RNA polymerase sigma-70 factor, ECF subfamily
MDDISPAHPEARSRLASAQSEPGDELDGLMIKVARGDHQAFEAVYDRLAAPAYGVIRKVVRDPAQSEEVTQEVLLEIWRTAARFDPAIGSAATWAMTIAHRRAIDRVRSAAAAAEREQKTADFRVPADEVVEAVEASLDRERVRRCLGGLTDAQRESITLAYYGGYSYREVAALLGTALGTIKTRIRDGLIRMRDCLGVSR